MTAEGDRKVRSKTVKTFDPRTVQHWRRWLVDHHDSEPEVWLVFHKRHTGRVSIAYEDAVNEALCFGWVDSLIKRFDDAPRPSPLKVPQYIQEALKRRPTAWNYFKSLAPSYRRMYVGWIDSARQQETKMRRLQEAIGLLAARRKLGLK